MSQEAGGQFRAGRPSSCVMKPVQLSIFSLADGSGSPSSASHPEKLPPKGRDSAPGSFDREVPVWPQGSSSRNGPCLSQRIAKLRSSCRQLDGDRLKTAILRAGHFDRPIEDVELQTRMQRLQIRIRQIREEASALGGSITGVCGVGRPSKKPSANDQRSQIAELEREISAIQQELEPLMAKFDTIPEPT
jgi:hypothetical protein